METCRDIDNAVSVGVSCAKKAWERFLANHKKVDADYIRYRDDAVAADVSNYKRRARRKNRRGWARRSNGCRRLRWRRREGYTALLRESKSQSRPNATLFQCPGIRTRDIESTYSLVNVRAAVTIGGTAVLTITPADEFNRTKVAKQRAVFGLCIYI